MPKPSFYICLLQLGYLRKSMYISLLLTMSVSVTIGTHCGYQSDFVQTHSKNLNTFLFLQNAYKCSCSPSTDVVKVVLVVLYIAMIDSLRQQFYLRVRQAGRDTGKNIKTAIERDILVPCVRNSFLTHVTRISLCMAV